MNSYWHKLLDLRDSQLRHILMCFRQGADPNSLSTVTEKQNIQAPPLYFFLCRTLDCPIRYKAREIDEVINCFVENGADLNRQNKEGNTILHLLAGQFKCKKKGGGIRLFCFSNTMRI
jgi:ankyrin repeat protein